MGTLLTLENLYLRLGCLKLIFKVLESRLAPYKPISVLDLQYTCE